MKTLPPVRVSAATYDRLQELTHGCLQACRQEAANGTPLYFPDGEERYGALWTRDFCYMVEGAGKLLPPAEILAGIDYLLAGQRDDGLIPDRAPADGTPVYEAGPIGQPLGAGPPADNGPFMAKLLCAYVRLTGDVVALKDRSHRLEAALETIPLGPDGLVEIDRNNPRPDYGFTDTVAKTGKALFASLLHWEACNTVAGAYRQGEYHDEAHAWYERAEQAGGRLNEFWSEGHGMMWAASRDCRQLDIWGSAYAAVLRVASKTQTTRIAHYLLGHWAGLIREGYVRHLPPGEYWKRTLVPLPEGTYQNGGYWAVPTGWVARVMATVDDSAARRLIETLVDSFARTGVHEWINPEQRVLNTYAAGAATLLGSVTRAKG